MIVLGAIGFFGAACFAVLRTVSSLSFWVELPISLLVGVLGLVGMSFVPSLFGDEAASLQWSRPVRCDSAQKKAAEEPHDKETSSDV